MHFRFNRNIGRLARNIEVRRVHVDALALQSVIKRQRLMYLAHYMQPDMTINSAVVGIEVVCVPFKSRPAAGRAVGVLRVGGAKGAFLVRCRVVDLDGEHIFLRAK
jgi:hypothetical protein